MNGVNNTDHVIAELLFYRKDLLLDKFSEKEHRKYFYLNIYWPKFLQQKIARQKTEGLHRKRKTPDTALLGFFLLHKTFYFDGTKNLFKIFEHKKE